jgi:hypothetical protein
VSGTNQVVSVEARQSDQVRRVAGAACELSNGKGVYYVTTPGTVTINRSYDPLNIRCEKSGFEPGFAMIGSVTKGMAFGNILFGGFVGAGVDMATGAAYDYPGSIRVLMGDSKAPSPAASTLDKLSEK